MRKRIINEINSESIERFIFIYNHSRKYCIDKIDQIRCKYKEIDNKLSNDSSYKIPSYLKDEVLNDIKKFIENQLLIIESIDVN